MAKILITGGSGSIAQALKKELEKKYTVLTPDRYDLDIGNRRNCVDYINKHKPNILINNAGVIFPQKINHLSIDKVIDEFSINVVAPFFLSSLLVKHNKKAKIINIGSTSGLKGRAGWGGYCASKSALISLTETLQDEGYDAVVYNPRRTKTKMRKELFPNEDESTLDTPEKVAKDIIKLAKL